MGRIFNKIAKDSLNDKLQGRCVQCGEPNDDPKSFFCKKCKADKID